MRQTEYNALTEYNLPEEVIEVSTITTFERHLDGYGDRKGLEGYGQVQASGTRLVRQLGQVGLFPCCTVGSLTV